jgi:hypothetical protein
MSSIDVEDETVYQHLPTMPDIITHNYALFQLSVEKFSSAELPPLSNDLIFTRTEQPFTAQPPTNLEGLRAAALGLYKVPSKGQLDMLETALKTTLKTRAKVNSYHNNNYNYLYLPLWIFDFWRKILDGYDHQQLWMQVYKWFAEVVRADSQMAQQVIQIQESLARIGWMEEVTVLGGCIHISRFSQFFLAGIDGCLTNDVMDLGIRLLNACLKSRESTHEHAQCIRVADIFFAEALRKEKHWAKSILLQCELQQICLERVTDLRFIFHKNKNHWVPFCICLDRCNFAYGM